MTEIETVLTAIDDEIRSCDVTLAKFIRGFADDPAHELEWGVVAFDAAATKHVLSKVAGYLRDGTSLDDVLTFAQHKVNAYAKRGSKSTSETSNLMRDSKMSAWAHVLSTLSFRRRCPCT